MMLPGEQQLTKCLVTCGRFTHQSCFSTYCLAMDLQALPIKCVWCRSLDPNPSAIEDVRAGGVKESLPRELYSPFPLFELSSSKIPVQDQVSPQEQVDELGYLGSRRGSNDTRTSTVSSRSGRSGSGSDNGTFNSNTSGTTPSNYNSETGSLKHWKDGSFQFDLGFEDHLRVDKVPLLL